MPPDEYGTEPLFPVPESYRPPKRKTQAWRAWTGRRTSCDDCIIAISRAEQTFLAEPARWAHSDEDGTHYYCYGHARIRRSWEGLA